MKPERMTDEEFEGSWKSTPGFVGWMWLVAEARRARSAEARMRKVLESLFAIDECSALIAGDMLCHFERPCQECINTLGIAIAMARESLNTEGGHAD